MRGIHRACAGFLSFPVFLWDTVCASLNLHLLPGKKTGLEGSPSAKQAPDPVQEAPHALTPALFFLNILIHFKLLYAWMGACVAQRRPENNLQELLLTNHHVGPGDRTQIIRLGGKRLLPASYLTSPHSEPFLLVCINYAD